MDVWAELSMTRRPNYSKGCKIRKNKSPLHIRNKTCRVHQKRENVTLETLRNSLKKQALWCPRVYSTHMLLSNILLLIILALNYYWSILLLLIFQSLAFNKMWIQAILSIHEGELQIHNGIGFNTKLISTVFLKHYQNTQPRHEKYACFSFGIPT